MSCSIVRLHIESCRIGESNLNLLFSVCKLLVSFGWFSKMQKMANTLIKAIILVVFVFYLSINAKAQSALSREITPVNADSFYVKEMAYAGSMKSVEIFKAIHKNPEPGFMETGTPAIIENKLLILGSEVIASIGKNCLAGVSV